MFKLFNVKKFYTVNNVSELDFLKKNKKINISPNTVDSVYYAAVGTCNTLRPP